MNMKLFENIILVLSFYNIVYDGYIYYKLPNNDSHYNSTQSQKEKPLDIILRIITILLYLAFLIIIIWSKLFPDGFVTIFCVIPGWLMYIFNALNASNTIKEVILGNSGNSNLKFSEKYNIDLIAMILISFKPYIPIESIIGKIISSNRNHIHSEILLTAIIYTYAFAFTFLFVVELMTPLKHIKKILVFIHDKTLYFFKYLAKELRDKDINAFIRADYTKRLKTYASQHNQISKTIILLCPVPLFFIIDIIIGFFKLIYVILILTNITLLCGIILYIEKLILYLINLFTRIPGRKVIKNMFKLSGIISATIVIIVAKLSLVYKFDETYIGTIEFIASTIIIPVIFEWVYSNKCDEMNADISTN